VRLIDEFLKRLDIMMRKNRYNTMNVRLKDKAKVDRCQARNSSSEVTMK
jgi:hypothetical protein